MRESGGGRGIRTLDTLLGYTHFPGVRLRPLGHPSAEDGVIAISAALRKPLFAFFVRSYTAATAGRGDTPARRMRSHVQAFS